MTVLAAHQPHYLPYPGVLSKLDAADVFVIRDTLQYTKQEWQNRNRIRAPEGWRWLTLPVHATADKRINEVEVATNVNWLAKHRRIFAVHYKNAPFRSRSESIFETPGLATQKKLSEIATRTFLELAKSIGTTTSIVLESAIIGTNPLPPSDFGLIELCKRLDCDTYLSGDGAQCYMRLDRWRASGVRVVWHRCIPQPYPQPYIGWVPNLSSLDLLACVADPLSYIRLCRNTFS